MPVKVKLDNGRIIQFDGSPTTDQINSVVANLNKNPDTPAPSPAPSSNFDYNKIAPNNFGMNDTSQQMFSDPSAPDNIPTTIINDAARPFAKAMSTAVVAAKAATGNLKDNSLNSELNSTPSYFQPIGGQAFLSYKDGLIGPGEATARASADAVGTAAQIASYFVTAPLKITGTGFQAFKSFLASTAGISSTIGVGAAGQSFGQGDNIGTAALKGAEGYIGTTSTFGLMDKAATLFRNYGLKLIQNQAVAKTGQELNGTITDLVTSNPQILSELYVKDPKMVQSYLVSSEGQAFAEKFNQQMLQTRNQAIDTLLPNVNNPDLLTHNVYVGMADKSGQDFQLGAQAMYDKVKASNSVTAELPKFQAATAELRKGMQGPVADANGVIKSAPGVYESLIGSQTGSPAQDFLKFVDSNISSAGASIKDVLHIMEGSFQYMTGASAEDINTIRNIMGALRTDVRAGLPKADVEAWDLAHNAWQKASSMYSDPILNDIKNSGFADSIVNGIMTLKPGPERDFIMGVLQQSPENSQNLLINTVLSRAKQMDHADATKYISDFRKSIASYDGTKSFLTAQQDSMLKAFQDFSSQDLFNTTIDMQNALGLTTKEYQNMVSGLEKVNIFDELKNGGFDKVAENFNTLVLREPQKIEKVIGNYTAEQKQTFGLMIFKDLLEKPNLSLIPDPANPGHMMMGADFMKTYSDAYQAIKNAQMRTGDPTLYGMFSPKENELLTKGFQELNRLNILKSGSTHSDMTKILNGIVGILYLKMGYVTGATRAGGRMFSDAAGQSANGINITSEMVQKAISEMQTVGTLPPASPISDYIHALNAHFFPQAVGNTIINGGKD